MKQQKKETHLEHPSSEWLQMERIMREERRALDQECKQIWRDVVIAYTSASNSTDVRKCIEWANEVEKVYAERFKK